MNGTPREENIGLLGVDDDNHRGYSSFLFRVPRAFMIKSFFLRVVWFLVPSFLQSHRVREHPKLHPTAYLDGIRGLAALAVFFYHNAYQAYMAGAGWGVDNHNYDTLRLPFIRLLYGGPPAVSIFFVVGGYALSYRPLKLMRNHNFLDFSTAMTSMVFRRFFRLFLPITASTFIVTCLLQAHAYEWTQQIAGNRAYYRVFPEPHPVRIPNPWNQLKDWSWHVFKEVHVFGWDNDFPTNVYDVHLWTIPIEYRCSLCLFLVLVGTARMKPAWRYAALVAITAFTFRHSRWELLCFLSGMALAEWDHIRGAHTLPADKQPATSRLQRASWHSGCIIGMYLMSFPQGKWEVTPFFMSLSKLTPSWWHTEVPRLWWSLGAAVFILSVSRLPWWQQLFTSSVPQYLGRISYALYLTHGPVMHVIGFHVQKWTWSVTGVEGIGYQIGFHLGVLIYAPIVIMFADAFWRAVDMPTAKFAKWLETQISVVSDPRREPDHK